MSKPKVKPGRKDARIKELREENESLRQQMARLEARVEQTAAESDRSLEGDKATDSRRRLDDAAADAPFDPTQPPPGMTRMIFHATVERVYLEYGGEVLDIAIANTLAKLRAFKSQIDAHEWGGESWGPVITPWEDRMTASMLLKLKRERAKLIAEAQKEFHALRKERQSKDTTDQPETDNAATDGATTATERPDEQDANLRNGGQDGRAPGAPALSFTPDDTFKQAWVQWLNDPGTHEMPHGTREVMEKLRFSLENGTPLPPDLHELAIYVQQNEEAAAESFARAEAPNDYDPPTDAGGPTWDHGR